MTANEIIRRAIIQEEPGMPEIIIELRLDDRNKHEDARYRWFESETGAESAVSGADIDSALENGEIAWRNWHFSFINE